MALQGALTKVEHEQLVAISQGYAVELSEVGTGFCILKPVLRKSFGLVNNVEIRLNLFVVDTIVDDAPAFEMFCEEIAERKKAGAGVQVCYLFEYLTVGREISYFRESEDYFRIRGKACKRAVNYGFYFLRNGGKSPFESSSGFSERVT